MTVPIKERTEKMTQIDSSSHFTISENITDVRIKLKRKFNYRGVKRTLFNYFLNPQEINVLDNLVSSDEKVLNFVTLEDTNEEITNKIMCLLEKNSSLRKTKNAVTIHVSRFRDMILDMYRDCMKKPIMSEIEKSPYLSDIKYIMPFGNSRPRYRRMFTQSQIRRIMDLSDFVLFTHNQPGRYTLKDHKREMMYFITGNTLFMVSLAWYKGLRQYVTSSIAEPSVLCGMFDLHSDQKQEPSIDKSLYEISLGLDPEILFYKKVNGKPDYKNIISASEIIRKIPLIGREIGLDACSELGELRPKFSFSPEETTMHAKKTLAKLQKHLMDVSYEGIPGKDMFIEGGGGCLRSIGGHIHIGNKLLSTIVRDGSPDETKQKVMPLLKMLDHFLYYPIKNNIHGGLRNWGMLRDAIPGFTPTDKKVLSELKKITPPVKSGFAFGGYEKESAIRAKTYGIEYRSLPSFISSEELTYLILKITQEITKHFLRIAFEPSEPLEHTFRQEPTKEDYERYLDKNESNSFNDFLYGTRNDIFLHHLFDNWSIEKPIPPTVEVLFCGDEDRQTPTMKKVISKHLQSNKEIKNAIGTRLNIWIRAEHKKIDGEKHVMMISPTRTTHKIKLCNAESIKSILRRRGNNKVHLILVITQEVSGLFSNDTNFWSELSSDIADFLTRPNKEDFSIPLEYEEVLPEIKLIGTKLKSACKIIEEMNDTKYITDKESKDFHYMVSSLHEIKITGKTNRKISDLEELINKYIPKKKEKKIKTGVRV